MGKLSQILDVKTSVTPHLSSAINGLKNDDVFADVVMLGSEGHFSDFF